MQYKVRDQFFVHMAGEVYAPGAVIDLAEDALALVAHQVEPVEAPKPSRKAKADGVQ